MIKNNKLKNISDKMERNDFKFGIRKFSVGTASVLLSVGVALSIGTSNVQAADGDVVAETPVSEVATQDEKPAAEEVPAAETPVVNETVTEDTADLQTEDNVDNTEITEKNNSEVAVVARAARSLNDDEPIDNGPIIDGSITGSGKNLWVGRTDSTKPDIKHGISIGTKNDVTTLNGDKAFIDMSQNENGEFYLHFAYKNDSNQEVGILDTVWLPSYNNSDPSRTIFPVINTDPAGLSALTLGLGEEQIEYAIPIPGNSGDNIYLTADKVDSANISAIRNLRITGKLQPGQEAHLYIPYKIENFQDLAKKGIDGIGAVSFSVSDSLLYNAGAGIGYVDLGKGFSFNGVATAPATKVNEALENVFAGKTDWQPLYVEDLGNGQYKYINDDELTGIKLSREDVVFNNGDVINDSSKLYLGGYYTVKNLQKIFDQISNKGYAILVDDNNGQPKIFSEVNYGTGNNSAINDGDYTDGSVYVIVQKVFDTKDKVVTDVDGNWSPEMNLNSKPTLQTTTITPAFNVKTIDLDGKYTYEVKDSKGEVVTDTSKLKPGLYTVTYKYKLADGNVVSSTSTISVPIPWTDLEPSKPVTPPTPPTPPVDNNENGGGSGSEENNDSSPESQEKPDNETDSDKLPGSENDSDNNGQSGLQSGNTGNGNVQGQYAGNVNNSAVGNKSASQLPQTGESHSSMATILGLVAVAMATIVGLFTFKKKKEN